MNMPAYMLIIVAELHIYIRMPQFITSRTLLSSGCADFGFVHRLLI